MRIKSPPSFNDLFTGYGQNAPSFGSQFTGMFERPNEQRLQLGGLNNLPQQQQQQPNFGSQFGNMFTNWFNPPQQQQPVLPNSSTGGQPPLFGDILMGGLFGNQQPGIGQPSQAQPRPAMGPNWAANIVGGEWQKRMQANPTAFADPFAATRQARAQAATKQALKANPTLGYNGQQWMAHDQQRLAQQYGNTAPIYQVPGGGESMSPFYSPQAIAQRQQRAALRPPGRGSIR
jgi:hypothetical protein